MLREIKAFLDGKAGASLSEIARHLSGDKEAVAGALEMWIRKGKVQKLEPACKTGSCKDCSSCMSMFDMVYYKWVG